MPELNIYEKIYKYFISRFPEALVEKSGGYFFEILSKFSAPPQIKAKKPLVLGDVKIELPVGLSAGWADSVSKMIVIHKLGAGFVTSKTITLNPREGNPRPRLVRGPNFLINSMGLPNPGAYSWAKQLEKEKLDFPWIQSIYGENIKEYETIIELLEPLVNIFEINFSCPNLPHDIPNIPLAVKQIKEIAGMTKRPILIKLSPKNKPSGNLKIIEQVHEHINGVVLINTVPVYSKELGNPLKRGGLSGGIIYDELINHLKVVRKEYPSQKELVIIATGGIDSANKAFEIVSQFDVAVSTLTGFLMKGPRVFLELAEGLVKAQESKEEKLIEKIRTIK